MGGIVGMGPWPDLPTNSDGAIVCEGWNCGNGPMKIVVKTLGLFASPVAASLAPGSRGKMLVASSEQLRSSLARD